MSNDRNPKSNTEPQAHDSQKIKNEVAALCLDVIKHLSVKHNLSDDEFVVDFLSRMDAMAKDSSITHRFDFEDRVTKFIWTTKDKIPGHLAKLLDSIDIEVTKVLSTPSNELNKLKESMQVEINPDFYQKVATLVHKSLNDIVPPSKEIKSYLNEILVDAKSLGKKHVSDEEIKDFGDRMSKKIDAKISTYQSNEKKASSKIVPGFSSPLFQIGQSSLHHDVQVLRGFRNELEDICGLGLFYKKNKSPE